MEKDELLIRMVIFTMVNGKKVKRAEMEFLSIKMGPCTMESGSMICTMAKVPSSGNTIRSNILANLSTVKRLVKESLSLMVMFMKGNSSMASSMVKENTTLPSQENNMKENF